MTNGDTPVIVQITLQTNFITETQLTSLQNNFVRTEGQKLLYTSLKIIEHIYQISWFNCL